MGEEKVKRIMGKDEVKGMSNLLENDRPEPRCYSSPLCAHPLLFRDHRHMEAGAESVAQRVGCTNMPYRVDN